MKILGLTAALALAAGRVVAPRRGHVDQGTAVAQPDRRQRLDLAGLKRSGITLSEAIKMSSKNNYGKLTPEVQKFSNRLSWGMNSVVRLSN
jgi:hypothetical protein